MFIDTYAIDLKRDELYRSQPEALIRLATWLKLDTQGMDHTQICRLVYWHLASNAA